MAKSGSDLISVKPSISLELQKEYLASGDDR
jgi:hypothetical protein